MAVNIADLKRTEETTIRKITLTKLESMGVESNKGSFIGWEYAIPQTGHSYTVYLGDGMVLRTSPVQDIKGTNKRVIIKTRNSIYQVDYIEDGTRKS